MVKNDWRIREDSFEPDILEEVNSVSDESVTEKEPEKSPAGFEIETLSPELDKAAFEYIATKKIPKGFDEKLVKKAAEDILTGKRFG